MKCILYSLAVFIEAICSFIRCGTEPVSRDCVFIGALPWNGSDVSSDQFSYRASAQRIDLEQVVIVMNSYKIIPLENYINCETKHISNVLLYLYPLSWTILHFFFPWPWIRNQNLLESNFLLASVIMNWNQCHSVFEYIFDAAV